MSSRTNDRELGADSPFLRLRQCVTGVCTDFISERVRDPETPYRLSLRLRVAVQGVDGFSLP